MPPLRSRPEGAPSRSGREVLPAWPREARRAACNELVEAAQHQLYDRIKRATQRENYPNYEKRPAGVTAQPVSNTSARTEYTQFSPARPPPRTDRPARTRISYAP